MAAVLQTTDKERLASVYKWTIVALGAITLAFAGYILPMPRFDLRFLVLAGLMILVSSRLSVQIPRVNANITVSDTFIFLVLLVYGGFAGLLLALVDGLFGGLRIRGRMLTVLFNCGMMICSTFVTVVVLRLFFGPTANLRSLEWSSFVAAIATMALVQYVISSGICAVGLAFKTGESIWETWQKHYLWTSITYLAGAAVAAVASNSIERAGLTILIVGGPVIFILYLTYHKYLDQIKATSAQAEQAERDRAEADRKSVV